MCVGFFLNYYVPQKNYDSSNYTDWVHKLRIILIASQKNYVLEALLGARPAAGATLDVVNA